MKKLKPFRQVLREMEEWESLPVLDEVYITEDGINYQYLSEGRKWVDGRFKNNIGIDLPSSGAGQKHAHVYGRKGNEVVIVNVDGTGSHGTKGKLPEKDAQALELRGFAIRKDRVVEWTDVGTVELLLG